VALLGYSTSLASHDPTPPAVPTPQPSEVTAAQQYVEPTGVVHDGIPISATKLNAPRVVYSVRVSPFRAEGLVTLAEAHISKCGENDTHTGGGQGDGDFGSPCERLQNNQEYNYAPHVGFKVVVGTSPSDTTGSIASSGRSQIDCNQAKHHCPLAMRANFLIPGSFVTRYVNFVVDAHHPNRRPGDVIELEADCLPTANSQPFEDYSNCHPPSPFVEIPNGSHGKLDVLRFGEGRGAGQGAVRDASEAGNAHIPDQTKKVVYSVAVNVDPGDVIEVDADLKSHPSNPANNPLVNAAVIMGDNATDTTGNHVTAWNGFNCHQNPCTHNKNGAVALGSGGLRYVNLVARPVNGGIDINTGAGGFLDVIKRLHFQP
jgi:hypothetical protein